MTTDRLDSILERLDALLAETDDDDRRREIREIQQLVVAVEAELEKAADDED